MIYKLFTAQAERQAILTTMKLLQRLITIVCIFCCSHLTIAGDPPKYIPVASYANRPEMDAVGARAGAILRAQKIESVAAGSAGMTISVPADRSVEALQLLAKAIEAEKLQLSLLVPKGDRYVIITPDSVLEPKKDQ